MKLDLDDKKIQQVIGCIKYIFSYYILQRNSLLHTCIFNRLVRQYFLPDTVGVQQKILSPTDPI